MGPWCIIRARRGEGFLGHPMGCRLDVITLLPVSFFEVGRLLLPWVLLHQVARPLYLVPPGGHQDWMINYNFLFKVHIKTCRPYLAKNTKIVALSLGGGASYPSPRSPGAPLGGHLAAPRGFLVVVVVCGPCVCVCPQGSPRRGVRRMPAVYTNSLKLTRIG